MYKIREIQIKSSIVYDINEYTFNLNFFKIVRVCIAARVAAKLRVLQYSLRVRYAGKKLFF